MYARNKELLYVQIFAKKEKRRNQPKTWCKRTNDDQTFIIKKLDEGGKGAWNLKFENFLGGKY